MENTAFSDTRVSFSVMSLEYGLVETVFGGSGFGSRSNPNPDGVVTTFVIRNSDGELVPVDEFQISLESLATSTPT
ncbi:MAG: hypothetical protein AAF360_17575, partial [Pseudomonadota bacterium]